MAGRSARTAATDATLACPNVRNVGEPRTARIVIVSPAICLSAKKIGIESEISGLLKPMEARPFG